MERLVRLVRLRLFYAKVARKRNPIILMALEQCGMPKDIYTNGVERNGRQCRAVNLATKRIRENCALSKNSSACDMLAYRELEVFH